MKLGSKVTLIVSFIFVSILNADNNWTPGFGSAGSCNVNAKCYSAWNNEVKAVVRILIGPDLYASGVLINNVNNNRRPFVLTAEHCVTGNDRFSDHGDMVFYFLYQSNSCSTPSLEPVALILKGATVVAANVASDFALLQLEDRIPTNWDLYFAGWTTSESAPSSACCIHHPRGDIKKISFEYNGIQSTNFVSSTYTWLANSHWVASNFDVGTLEFGSSGSPLFDWNHKIIGQTHGNDDLPDSAHDDFEYDFCAPGYTRRAQFCKFSWSWDYSSAHDAQLKYWLHPNSSGVVTLNGISNGNLSGTIDNDTRLSYSHTLSGNVVVTDNSDLIIANNANIVYNGKTITASNGRMILNEDGSIRNGELWGGEYSRNVTISQDVELQGDIIICFQTLILE